MGQFPFGDEVWGGSPAEVLHTIAHALAMQTPAERPVPPGGALYAVAFRCEAWTMPDAEPGTAQASENANDALRHRIRHRPDRIECRTFSAVDIEGVSYEVEQQRGQVPTMAIGYPEPGATRHTGSVFEALDLILWGLTGATPPDRSERAPVAVLTPNCPLCGSPPGVALPGLEQWWCDNTKCTLLFWNPAKSLAENLLDAGMVHLPGQREDGEA
jgi:hypothetical protein